jgi:hypothetical protein
MRSTPAGILVLAAAAIVGWGCDTVAGPATPDALPLAALRGQAAFTRECAPCHASGDAVDLAFFNFTDTTIVRRAVAHVDTATALDIVAFVHTRSVPRASRSLRLFQPGALVLGGDAAFAAALFGADQWPADLTTQDLQAIDPLQVKAAVPLPLWSQENGNLDWMPDTPLPVAILDDQEGRARARLTAYRASSTIENLMAAVAALRGADRRLDNPGAPCLFDVVDRVPDYISCFEVRRWTSTLAAQHMIRRGMTGRLHRAAHAVWWGTPPARPCTPASRSPRASAIGPRGCTWAGSSSRAASPASTPGTACCASGCRGTPRSSRCAAKLRGRRAASRPTPMPSSRRASPRHTGR